MLISLSNIKTLSDTVIDRRVTGFGTGVFKENMPRKKVSTTEVSPSSADLDDNEELVIRNTHEKRVRREKVRSDDNAITAEPVIDDDDDQDAGEFSPTSLAAVIYGDGGGDVENEFCSVHIRRNPDTMGDVFLTKCGSVTSYPKLANVSLATEQSDIEDRIRSEYGGGHYFFQLHYNGNLGRSWKATLADLPEAIAREKAKNDPAPAPQPTQSADPMQQFLDRVLMQKQLEDALFGDQKKRLEEQIAEMRREIDATKNNPAEPKSERLSMFETALSTPNTDLQGRLLDHLFPTDDGEKRHWIADTLDVVLQNKDAILGVLGSLLGGTAPPAYQPKPSIADLMRAQPPGELNAQPEQSTRGFRRRSATEEKPEHVEMTPEHAAELSEVADDIATGTDTAIDAELVENEGGATE